MSSENSEKLPPTARTLLALLAESGGAVYYYDPRVTTSGLTALRHRGLARVERSRNRPTIVLTCPDHWHEVEAADRAKPCPTCGSARAKPCPTCGSVR